MASEEHGKGSRTERLARAWKIKSIGAAALAITGLTLAPELAVFLTPFAAFEGFQAAGAAMVERRARNKRH